MKKIISCLLLLTLTYSFGQEMKICSYRDYMTEGELKKACDNFGYSSNVEAENVVDEILSIVGLYRNFIIKECPHISNAVAATVRSSLGSFERYIIYDNEFFKRVKNVTKTDWSAVSILAHEIGHHLNGHNLVSGINNHDAELQADEFSGFVLGKMGASLEESLRAINSFGSDENSKTHPKKSDRIRAISNGWNKSNSNSFNIKNNDNIELYNLNKMQVDKYLKMGLDESNKGDYNLAGDYLLKAFQYSNGTISEYLYYAAGSYVNGKDYNKALKYYLMLIKNGINKLDKTKQQEIYKNTALIYSQQGKVDDAINFFNVARRENPDDVSIMISQADLYLQRKDFEKYKEVIREAIKKNPTNADLHYNLGVISTNSGLKEDAEKYYLKAIQLNSSYKNAYLNLSILMLEKDNIIIDEMNRLGNSSADNKRYDYLKGARIQLFKSIIPYLEKYLELEDGNIEAKKTLLNMYHTIGEDKKYKKLSQRL